MLPFTKRPGREEESGDVLSKEDLEEAASAAASALKARPRPPMESVSDDEKTQLMPSKSVGEALGNALKAAPVPAAGRPAAGSSRGGSKKVVKRSSTGKRPADGEQMPTTISPAAVIKATLDSAARGQKPNDLGAGPPAELLEDYGDVHPADDGPQRTAVIANAIGNQLSTHAMQPHPAPVPPASRSVPPPASSGRSVPPPAASSSRSVPPPAQSSRSVPPPAASSSRSVPPPAQSSRSVPPPAQSARSVPPPAQSARSVPPPPASYPASVPSYAPPPMSSGYPPAPQYASSSSTSIPIPQMPQMAGGSMPPHFMVPQSPSDVRVDPPGTTVTSRSKISGRPAMSWALALGAVGLCVGVAAIALLRGRGDHLAETSASFVDPARAAGAKGAAAAQTAAAAGTEANVNAPPVAIPAADPATAADPGAAQSAPGVIGASTPAPQEPAADPKADSKPETNKRGGEAKSSPGPVATFRPPAPTWRPPSQPKAVVASTPSDESTASSSESKDTKKGGKKAGAKPGEDEEMKKALEQLQKSQLESTF